MLVSFSSFMVVLLLVCVVGVYRLSCVNFLLMMVLMVGLVGGIDG